MIMTILLDDAILTDHFNGIAEATVYLGQVRDEASIVVITRAEVLTGFAAADRQKAAMLLDGFPLFDLTKPIADLALGRPIQSHGQSTPYSYREHVALKSTISSSAPTR